VETQASETTDTQTPLRRTALYDLHLDSGAKMVPFAGYEMPVQYGLGVLGEHLHTRTKAGLFDVSHMGQARLIASDEDADAAALFEQLVPGGIQTLKEGRIRYTQLTNAQGGILDDLMATRFGNELWLVVNAACKEDDFAHIAQALDGQARLDIQQRALIALQGPMAASVLQRLVPEVTDLVFMQAAWMSWDAHEILISRCGYTGEDGFEISIATDQAEAFARALLAEDEVAAIGLGARDSLRLEAGLCLYGHDIDTSTTPAEAALLWSVPKRRRAEANFPGAAIINQQIENGPARLRVGIQPQGRAPAREGTVVQNQAGDEIGVITSGGFGPSAEGPIAMGYVTPESSEIGTQVNLIVRGKAMPALITALPFVPQRYAKG
jgi:aminomethyltransferase